MSYLRLEVYKFPLGECTNNGVSVTHKLFIPVPGAHITDADLELYRERGDKVQVMELNVDANGNPSVKPLGGKRHYMMGGNFAYTTDSRLQKAYPQFKQPVAIHDRVEG